MSVFNLFFTGDYLNEAGQLVADVSLDRLMATGYIKADFLRDQTPTPGDSAYWDRLYSLEIKPEHVAKANGIVIFRPWVKASAFANGAKDLVVLARAGVGYDKIDITACTENDVLVFNAPDTLTHSTASAALTLMLMLAKKVPQQQELVPAVC
jgi:phosphoglycerate dehydrogenase-like enzyme